ncbi:MAG: endonuclease MutS2 [Clostridia bacterium]|nr:endonuclease MutS2 [Clostridia bacterium]
MILHCREAELDKILALLAQETSCEDAASAAREIVPQTQEDSVRGLLRETDDAYVLLAKFGAPGFSGLVNITNALRRAGAGGVLSLKDLLKVAGVLSVFRAIDDWRSRNAGMQTSLDDRFFLISPNKYLEDRIRTVVLSEDEVADQASPELFEIRRKIRRSQVKAREQLEKMIHSTFYQKYLQEPIITQRSGRFVVPVKAEYRTQVQGLVHDTSSSGATVFIEPIGVVETNNEVRVLEAQEKAEIERILAELSAQAGSFADTIIESYHAAVELNLIFAKASLAYKMKAVTPKVNSEGRIVLKSARHPLIDPKAVVPIDVELGRSFDTLVITGPNTGGKTVALKTVALFTLMMMCGLMVPASEGSELSVFENVYVNIGDEQSIEQSLSTFSSHMKAIIEMLSTADHRSLVILDEIGSGTDPAEGAALAMAILEELRMRGAKIAATTHYAELKQYALETSGVENACCEFDITTLRPTYKLLIGVPGKSNAFAISQRLGMDPRLVARAGELLSEEDTLFSDAADRLEKMRVELEEQKAETQKLLSEAQESRRMASEELERAKMSARSELDRARGQAANIVSRTRARSDALLNELEEMQKQQNKVLTVEQKSRLRSEMQKLERGADPVERKKREVYRLPRQLRPGDRVLMMDLEKEAVVLSASPDSSTAEIQAGNLRTRVKISSLKLIEEVEKAAKREKRAITKELVARSPATEVDLRGMTVEEALMETDRAIDQALISGLSQITIIHGKGTGALRAAVQQYLKRHKSVDKYRLGSYGEGEAGVTIAQLKQ